MKIHFSVSKIKNRLRTTWASNTSKLRTTEPQQNFTGSYKKKACNGSPLALDKEGQGRSPDVFWVTNCCLERQGDGAF